MHLTWNITKSEIDINSIFHKQLIEIVSISLFRAGPLHYLLPEGKPVQEGLKSRRDSSPHHRPSWKRGESESPIG